MASRATDHHTFSIVRGDSHVLFRDWQASWFVQDDWRPSANVTLSYGLRHDLQQQSESRWTFAPRGGLAWTPAGDTRHVLRVAGGVFYSRIPADVALDVLRHDGIQVREYVVERPDFFPTIPPALDTFVTSLPTVRVSDDLDTPRTAAVSTSYEWQIAKPLFASISYTYRRGAHLLRTLNINEPDPVTGLRPRPDAGPVLQFASAGRSTRHSDQRHASPFVDARLAVRDLHAGIVTKRHRRAVQHGGRFHQPGGGIRTRGRRRSVIMRSPVAS